MSVICLNAKQQRKGIRYTIKHWLCVTNSLQSADFEIPLSELKAVLSDDHLTKLREVKLLGTYHYVHSPMVSQVTSQRAQEILTIPSAAELEEIPKNSNIIEEVNFIIVL